MASMQVVSFCLAVSSLFALVNAGCSPTSCCKKADCNAAGYICKGYNGVTCNCMVSLGARGKCVKGKDNGEKVKDFSECSSLNGACLFCSATCKEKQGCRIVPEREWCTMDSDCKTGLFCDGLLSVGCKGVCLRDAKLFTPQERQQELCPTLQAVMLAHASYAFEKVDRKKHCCEKGTVFFALEGTCVSRQKDPVTKQACTTAECKNTCEGIFIASELQQTSLDPRPPTGEGYFNAPGFKTTDWAATFGALTKVKEHAGKFDRQASASYGLIAAKNEIKGSKEGVTRTGSYAVSAMLGPSTLVVSFAGTNPAEFEDVMADLRSGAAEEFKPQEWKRKEAKPTFYVGAGFVQYYEQMRKTLFQAIKDEVEKGQVKEFLVVGHSLGGALANLCALDLAAKYPDTKLTLFTFGSPRVFKGKTTHPEQKLSADHALMIFSTSPNSVHRWVNSGDPVPALPGESLGFKHVGDGLEMHKNAKTPTQFKHCHSDYTPKANPLGANSYHLLGGASGYYEALSTQTTGCKVVTAVKTTDKKHDKKQSSLQGVQL